MIVRHTGLCFVRSPWRGFFVALVIGSITFLIAPSANADTLQLWTERFSPAGNQYGVELFLNNKFQTSIAELGPFLNTGQPEGRFILSTDPQAAQIIAYVINANPNPFESIRTLGDGNIYGGHFGQTSFFQSPRISNGVLIDGVGYPQPTGHVHGIFIQNSGSLVTYNLLGTGIVPEPPAWLLCLIGIAVVGFMKRLTYLGGPEITSDVIPVDSSNKEANAMVFYHNLV